MQTTCLVTAAPSPHCEALAATLTGFVRMCLRCRHRHGVQRGRGKRPYLAMVTDGAIWDLSVRGKIRFRALLLGWYAVLTMNQ